MKKRIPVLLLITLLVLCILVLIFNPIKKQEIIFQQEQIDDGNTTLTLIVKAPETCKIGEMVTIDATGSNADSFEWLVIPETKNFRVITNGQEALFCAGTPGSYIFVIAAMKDGILQPLTKLEIIVEDGPSIPIHNDFTIMIKSWLPQKADPKILEQLARSFERVASANHAEVADLIKITALSNRAILGKNMTQYKPFLVALSTHLKTNMAEANLDAHVILWFNIAKALRHG